MAQPAAAGTSWKLKLALVWGGELFSVLTSSVLQMGLIWHITFATESAGALSLASLAGFLPLALFGAVAGTVVDRVSLKSALVGADLFVAAVSAGVAVLSARGSLGVAAVIAALFLRAIGSAFHGPAINSLTPALAPPEHLTRLAGVSQAVQSGGYIAGTALAAVIYPTLGLTAMVAMDVGGALLASAAVLLARLDLPRKAAEKPNATPAGPRGLLRETAEGFRALRAERGLFALLWCGFAFSLVFSPISALYPLMTIGHFGGNEAAAALVEVAFSVGMIAGGVVLGATGGFKNRVVSIMFATVAFGAATLVSGLLGTDGFPVFAVMATVMGMSSPFYSGPQVALMQERIAPECLGRVFGLYSSIMSLALPLGLVASTLFADGVGVAVWFAGSGVAMLVLAALTWAIPVVRTADSQR